MIELVHYCIDEGISTSRQGGAPPLNPDINVYYDVLTDNNETGDSKEEMTTTSRHTMMRLTVCLMY